MHACMRGFWVPKAIAEATGTQQGPWRSHHQEKKSNVRCAREDPTKDRQLGCLLAYLTSASNTSWSIYNIQNLRVCDLDVIFNLTNSNWCSAITNSIILTSIPWKINSGIWSWRLCEGGHQNAGGLYYIFVTFEHEMILRFNVAQPWILREYP